MSTFRSQMYRLYPTAIQEEYFLRSWGASRHAFNWALALRKRYYRRYGKSVSGMTLSKKWSRHKKNKKKWAAEIGKVITQTAIHSVDVAYKKFFSGQNRFPRFKSKYRSRCSFRVADSADQMRFDGGKVKLPVIGFVRFRGEHRWPKAKLCRASVSSDGGRWFLSVLYELPDPKPEPHQGPTCGVDLGCTTFATVSSNQEITHEVKPPKPYAKTKRRLKRLQRSVSRKQKGSKNRERAKRKLSRLHFRVKSIRQDFLHKLSRKLVQTYSTVVLEDLSVKGMTRGFLRKAISDLGFGEFRRQVEYKAIETGTRVVIAPRFFPSSKACNKCGLIRETLELSERQWTCECGVAHNRDHNAARNLEELHQLPVNDGKVTPVETGSSSSPRKRGRGAGRGSRNVSSLEEIQH